MKNELLARAMTEIDDDLLEEARRPLPRRRMIPTFTRCAAAAACFLLVFAAVISVVLRGGGDAVTVSVDGVKVSDGGSLEKPIEMPLTATMQTPRLNEGTEIPLHIDAGEGGEVTLDVSEGSVIVTDGGEELKSMVITEDADLMWVVDPARVKSFDLTLRSEDKTIKLTAAVDEQRSMLIVTSAADQK